VLVQVKGAGAGGAGVGVVQADGAGVIFLVSPPAAQQCQQQCQP
jgi:hypothetical protein